jgi:hypothetical protein
MPEIFTAGADCWDGTGESCEAESGDAEYLSCVHEETARNQPIAKRDNFIFDKEAGHKIVELPKPNQEKPFEQDLIPSSLSF